LTRLDPRGTAQPRVKALDAPAFSPPAKMRIDRLPRREVVGQHPPLAAAFEKIEERVHDLARRMLGVLALIGEYGLG
jgi:hypothetical protein